jgi:hypothetical protein
MTLSISLWDHPRGPYHAIPAPEIEGWETAGFEDWRSKVYGSPPFRELGLRLFPQLATDDLHVPPTGLDAFADECRKVLAASDSLGAQLRLDPVDLRYRMIRFLAIVELARYRGAGIAIS